MYRVGELVFAKIKGYRHWPAKINQILEKEKNNTTVYNVTFFGDLKTSIVNESNLLSYSENLHIHGVAQVDNFRNQTFNKALKDAEIAFKALETSENDSNTNLTSQASVSNMEDIHIKLQNSQRANLETSLSLAAEVGNDSNTNLTSQASVSNMEDIHIKLQNSQETDLETSLSLAAEVGNALLIENNKLKHDLFDISQQNEELLKQIMESNNFGISQYQDRIEELENEKYILIDKNNKLVESVNEVEKQLIKEKKLRDDLLSMFEDQDKEKENIINQRETEIVRLQIKIRQMESENKNTLKETPKIWKNSETQTIHANVDLHNHSTYVHLQLAQLKNRQDQMEQVINKIKEDLHTPCELKCSAPFVHQTPQTNVRSEAFSKSHPSPKIKKKENSKKNVFSISLQVAKNKALNTFQTTELISEQPDENLITVGISQTNTKKLSPYDQELNTTTDGSLLTSNTTEGNSQTQTKKLLLKTPQLNDQPSDDESEIPQTRIIARRNVVIENNVTKSPPKPINHGYYYRTPPGTKTDSNNEDFYAELIKVEIGKNPLKTNKETDGKAASPLKAQGEINTEVKDQDDIGLERPTQEGTFLETRQRKKVKHKEAITTRVFLNKKYWK